jgi:hypothetical protein
MALRAVPAYEPEAVRIAHDLDNRSALNKSQAD